MFRILIMKVSTNRHNTWKSWLLGLKFFHNYTDWNYHGFLCYKSFINQFAYSQCSASSALSIKINQNNKKSKTKKKQINQQTNKEKSKQKTKQKQNRIFMA